MSHSPPAWLTVLFSLFFAASLSAQADDRANDFKLHLQRLDSPAAVERAQATLDMAALELNLAHEMRMAWANASVQQRVGMFKVAARLQDTGLRKQAAAALAGDDSRLKIGAAIYLDQLAWAELTKQHELAATEAAHWDEYLERRMRRDVADLLLDAQLKPGRYDGQFDTLRARGTELLDRHLLSLLALEPQWAETLNESVRRRLDRGIEAERMHSSAWAQLIRSNEGFEAATLYLRTMEYSELVRAAQAQLRRGQFIAALEVANQVRAAAARALAESDHGPRHITMLKQAYLALLLFEPEPSFAVASDTSLLRVEIEITLSRVGDHELLDARLATLRMQLDAVIEAGPNVTARPSARPDLQAGNEIAHLLLRRGDHAAAEAQWQSMINDAQAQMARSDSRTRVSLSSYMGAVYYNLACAQALQLKLSAGHESLKKAVSHGYKDFQWMLEDGDLRPMQGFEPFRAWFTEVAPMYLADRLAADGR